MRITEIIRAQQNEDMSITKVRGRELVNIELLRGLGGEGLYINDYRITPHKPTGHARSCSRGRGESSL